MRASEARTGLSARPACHRSWLAYGTFSPLTPEVGAVCGKAARTDLCGGREVTRVPTATEGASEAGAISRCKSGQIGPSQIKVLLDSRLRFLLFYAKLTPRSPHVAAM